MSSVYAPRHSALTKGVMASFPGLQLIVSNLSIETWTMGNILSQTNAAIGIQYYGVLLVYYLYIVQRQLEMTHKSAVGMYMQCTITETPLQCTVRYSAPC